VRDDFSSGSEDDVVQEMSYEEERFESRGKIGSGGMGVVFRAFDHRLEREVALKTLRHAIGRDLFRFKREFRALTDIVHPNLVALHELHTVGDEWFFSMELVEGVPFVEWLRRIDVVDEPTVGFPHEQTMPTRAAEPAMRSAEPLNVDRLREALVQLVDGVLALHVSGKLHRDLKPSNVLVTGDGRVVLLDFGLISDVETQRVDLTHDQAAVGTPAYMSPEQAADQPLTEASDWYAVGVMLYEALTGRRPFDGSAEQMMRRKQRETPLPPSVIDPRVPPVLDELCMRLLSREPEDRPTGRAILAALGASPSRTTLDLERSVTTGPFVGRTDELDVLRRAYAASRRHGVAVFVRGDSGMGKSQLVRRFLDEVGSDTLVLEGRCYERESVPYKALDTVIDALTGALMRLPEDRLEQVVPRDVATLARLFPVLRRVPPIDQRALMASFPSDAVEIRRRAFGALRFILDRLASFGPVVISIDDLQWGDADSAVFLAELIHHTEPVPVMLVLIHRLDDDSGVVGKVQIPRPGIPPGDTRAIEVGPLRDGEARQLLHALRGANADDSTEILVREGGGHPLFLAELARGTGVHARGPGERDEAASLDELLTMRIGALPASAAALLCTVAVAGRPVPLDQAQRAAGLGSSSDLALLRAERLIRVRHVGESDVAYIEPYHDRIRAAAVSTLHHGQRTYIHEALARAIESAGAHDLEALVAHWVSADQPARAAGYAASAARSAEHKLAFHHAAALYLLALTHGGATGDERRQLLRLRADALANAGALDDAAAAYAEAAVGADEDEALDLERLQLEQILRRGRLEEGRALARKVLGRVGITMPNNAGSALRSALFERLRLKLRRGGLDCAEREPKDIPPDLLRRLRVLNTTASACAFVDPLLGKALQFRFLRTALEAGEPELLSRALTEEMGYQGMAGVSNRRHVEAVVSRLSRVSARQQNPGLAGFATAGEGLSCYLMGRWRDAARLLDQGMRAMREHTAGLRWETTLAELYLTSSLFYLGETRDLARLVPALLRDAVDRGDVYAQHGLRGWRSNVAWLVMGKADEARANAEQVAAERNTAQGFHLQHWFELLAQTQIDLYVGDTERAWQRLEGSWKLLTSSLLPRIQNIRVESSHLRTRVLVARAYDKPDERKDLLREATRHARALDKEGAGWAGAIAENTRALVALAQGDRGGAAQLLERAERAYASCDMALHANVVRIRRGELEGGTAGAAWCADAQRAMHEQAVADPTALARMICPWPAQP
jgi:eukaryotic-like serine/threonine-protein kinase